MYSSQAVSRSTSYFENVENKLKKRGDQKKCQICKTKFGAITREHKCKRCLRSICSKCGKDKKKLAMSWSNDSKIVGKWMEALGIAKEQQSALVAEFANSKSPSQELTESSAYLALQQMFPNNDQFLSKYLDNFSFFEMFNYLTVNIKDEELRATLNTVLTAFLNKYHLIVGLSQEILDVAMFLLCFCSPAHAYTVLVTLYVKKFPERYYPINLKKTGFQLKKEQVDVLLGVLKNNYQVDNMKLPFLGKFVERYAVTVISSFNIGLLDFLSCFNIFEVILNNCRYQGALPEVLKSMLLMTVMNAELISSLGFNNNELVSQMLMQTDFEAIRDKLAEKLPPELLYFGQDQLMPGAERNSSAVVAQAQQPSSVDAQRETITTIVTGNRVSESGDNGAAAAELQAAVKQIEDQNKSLSQAVAASEQLQEQNKTLSEALKAAEERHVAELQQVQQRHAEVLQQYAAQLQSAMAAAQSSSDAIAAENEHLKQEQKTLKQQLDVLLIDLAAQNQRAAALQVENDVKAQMISKLGGELDQLMRGQKDQSVVEQQQVRILQEQIQQLQIKHAAELSEEKSRHASEVVTHNAEAQKQLAEASSKHQQELEIKEKSAQVQLRRLELELSQQWENKLAQNENELEKVREQLALAQSDLKKEKRANETLREEAEKVAIALQGEKHALLASEKQAFEEKYAHFQQSFEAQREQLQKQHQGELQQTRDTHETALQMLRTHVQQLELANQQLQEANKQLQEAYQQLQESNQQLKETNQQVVSQVQEKQNIINDKEHELSELRQLSSQKEFALTQKLTSIEVAQQQLEIHKNQAIEALEKSQHEIIQKANLAESRCAQLEQELHNAQNSHHSLAKEHTLALEALRLQLLEEHLQSVKALTDKHHQEMLQLQREESSRAAEAHNTALERQQRDSEAMAARFKSDSEQLKVQHQEELLRIQTHLQLQIAQKSEELNHLRSNHSTREEQLTKQIQLLEQQVNSALAQSSSSDELREGFIKAKDQELINQRENAQIIEKQLREQLATAQRESENVQEQIRQSQVEQEALLIGLREEHEKALQACNRESHEQIDTLKQQLANFANQLQESQEKVRQLENEVAERTRLATILEEDKKQLSQRETEQQKLLAAESAQQALILNEKIEHLSHELKTTQELLQNERIKQEELVNEHEKQIATLRQENALLLEHEKAAFKEQNEQLTTQLAKAEEEIQKQQHQKSESHSSLQAANAALLAQIASVQLAKGTAEAQLESVRKELKELATKLEKSQDALEEAQRERDKVVRERDRELLRVTDLNKKIVLLTENFELERELIGKQSAKRQSDEELGLEALKTKLQETELRLSMQKNDAELQIQTLGQSLERSVVELQEVREQLLEVQEQLLAQKREAEKQINELNQSLEQKTIQLRELENQSLALSFEQNDHSNNKDEIEELKRLLYESQENAEELQTIVNRQIIRLEQQESELQKAKQMRDLRVSSVDQEISRLEAQLTAQQIKYRDLQEEQRTIKLEKENLWNRIQQMDQTIAQQGRVGSSTVQVRQLQEEIDILKAQDTAKKQVIQELQRQLLAFDKSPVTHGGTQESGIGVRMAQEKLKRACAKLFLLALENQRMRTIAQELYDECERWKIDCFYLKKLDAQKEQSGSLAANGTYLSTQSSSSGNGLGSQ